MTGTAESAAAQIEQALDSGFPVLYVVTWEEERLRGLLEGDRPLWTWTAARGFLDGPGAEHDLADPVAALRFVAEHEGEATWLFKDLPGQFADNPALVRAARDVYDALEAGGGVAVLTHPQSLVPPTLSKEVFLLNLPLPDADELLAALQGMGLDRDDEWLERCANAMQGLSLDEGRHLLQRLINDGIDDIDAALVEIYRVKGQLLMKENCLEVIPARFDIDQVGGLDNLKKWIVSREKLFSKEARAEGIQAPAGVLFMGVSGCGKSLAAKTIPSAWGLPLIRLDMNLVMSGSWGSPETAWERAIRVVESAAPVVLWIDEIENSFGYSEGAVSGGNMTIFSSFLTWMQEKPQDVFVAATANKIEMLPAEMIRKGRFDEVFFVDLPRQPAREEILRIHIERQQGDPAEFDLDHLAEIMDGWTGAEIEALVKASRVDAFTRGETFTYDDLIRNIYRTVPLSRTMAEQLDALRKWSRHRATPAEPRGA